MRPRKPYLTFLADSNGLTYYVQAGQIIKDNNPTPLTHDSVGWMTDGLSFARNQTYYGLNRAFSGELKFTGDAATIIRYLFYTQKGVEQDLFYLIWKWNDATDIYEMYYKGQLDLSTFDDFAIEGVKVNSIEGGVLKLLKAYESTIFSFPLDGTIPENILVNISGILFQDTFTYSFASVTGVQKGFALPISFNLNTGDNIGIEHSGQAFEQMPNGNFNDYVASSKNYIFSSVAPIQLTIAGKLTIKSQINTPFPGNILIAFYTSQNREFNIVNEVISSGVTKTYEFNLTINLAANEELFVLCNANEPGASLNVLDISQTDFTIQFTSQFKDTSAYCITAADLFKLLIDKITAGKYPSLSNYLQNKINLVCTSGDALRAWSYIPTPGVPVIPIQLKTCLKDFWDAFNSILNASLSNENIDGTDTLFFEEKGDVFDSSNVDIDLGEVKELDISYASDLLFNEIEIGYPDQAYDQQSGKQEYNSTITFKAPITTKQKKLSLISKYRADSRGIEFTRFNSVPSGGSSITNNSSDNAVFILNVDTSSNALNFQASNINAQDATNPMDVFFDTFSGNSTNIQHTNSLFFYTGTQPAKVTITAQVQRIGGPGIDALQLLVNDVSVGNILDNNSPFSINLTLNFNDTIRIHSVFTGVGSPQITSALLNFAFTSQQVYNLKRVTYDSITGVDNPTTAYNIEELTPKRMLLKWGNYIRSILYNFGFNNLTFESGLKNYLLSTTINGQTITEGSDALIGSLDDILFYPLYFKFKTKVPFNFSQLLSGAVNSHIKFNYNGKTFYGFPQEVKQQFALNESQEWKLLASPLINLSDLQNLEVDGLNFLDLMGYATFIPELCPVKFVPLNNVLPAQYHFKHMDGWWSSEQFQNYLDSISYFQKWQQNDIIFLQCMTNGLGPVAIQFLDANGKVVLTDSLTATSDSAVKSPYILYQKSFGLNSFAEGVYYITLTAGTGGTVTSFISEGLYIKADHPDTLLFEYSNSRNKQSCIFSSGYTPSFRVEGWLDGFTPAAHFSTFEDQPADITVINGIPYRIHTLNIGYGRGIPAWAIDKLSRILLLDNTNCDGLGITRNGDKDFTKVDVPGWPFKYWTIEIREEDNRDGVTLNTTGQLDQNVTVEYQINTKGFGDGDKGDNVVIIQTID
jgi:hypothetical protein